VIPTGIEHGTVTVHFEKQSFEVTTFRSEADYIDGRHPSSVTFIPSLEEDLKRRDFTINAFAADCRDGRIIDLHDGKKDLKTRSSGQSAIPAAFR
jgi:tRNA nucleotidyltransferase/poly(A) polymerase